MDISTRYLGLPLTSPIVASASPITKTFDGLMRLVDVNPGAIVMHSLFEEQIDAASKEIHHYMDHGAESFGEALSYFPDFETFNVGPDEYLEFIFKAKKRTKIPIIGSLNGVSRGGWIEYAKLIEEAGADALELNIYYINTDPDRTGQEVEGLYLDVVRSVVDSVDIPVAVKMGPFFSSVPNMCRRMANMGVKGFVLFNRFYQPDLNIEEMEVVNDLKLSTSNSLRLPLRWVAIMYSRIQADFAISSGVHSGRDVLKGVMAGANITMMTAELLKRGVERIPQIKKEIQSWMEMHEFSSIMKMRGALSQRNTSDPAAYERANYMKVLESVKQDPTGKMIW